MKYISCVDKDISLIRFGHLWDILVNIQNKYHIYYTVYVYYISILLYYVINISLAHY